jgi:hypothetical protein
MAASANAAAMPRLLGSLRSSNMVVLDAEHTRRQAFTAGGVRLGARS